MHHDDPGYDERHEADCARDADPGDVERPGADELDDSDLDVDDDEPAPRLERIADDWDNERWADNRWLR